MATVLSGTELAAFERWGYVRLRAAFPPALALEMQDAMWAELKQEFGIDRDDRSTWRVPPHDLKRAKYDPRNEAMCTDRLVGALGDLVEGGRVDVPGDWGRILVTFPEPAPPVWTVPTKIWHWDAALHQEVGAVRRLLVLTFFSTVEPRGGGTVIVGGSHRLLRRFHDELPAEDREAAHRTLRLRFMRWDPWLRRLAGLEEETGARDAHFMDAPTEVQGVPVQVVELTGQPGDAVLCHPLMLHATAGNRADVPRFMRIRFRVDAARTA